MSTCVFEGGSSCMYEWGGEWVGLFLSEWSESVRVLSACGLYS